MYISEFVKSQSTTLDTVKFYIKNGLLTPEKDGSWYVFGEQDADDFQNIIELKKLGFSIKAIKRIKELHSTSCSTDEQWTENLSIVTDELADIDSNIVKLMSRKAKLNKIRTELKEKLRR
ncbi:MerR family transcriptional regulator [Floricoccus penangensis]|uniref:MerR family transcriptional regulator n=1 Tax=Floricoccus penangensis TaxID=1859475 RepID=UPI00203FA0E3|nr:MerR family transcriptional regulator [Floricoccus penangensis]URZ86620.1 MerR family transcriptional regulator [Floricoccus penangensis]